MFEPGTALGHYEVLSPLGKGGMGEVYRAMDRTLGREVAIKVLPDAFGHDPIRVARFKQEARAAAALNHPNICAIHEVGDHDGQPFIVMELLRGQTLEARLSSQGRLECDEVLELSTQLADALDAAHTAGIVHRDVKPANIFITARGQAKILDFGIAKTNSLNAAEALTNTRDVEQLTGNGTTLGTLAYMSPEQALGKELDPRTDLFSLGAVIYEALTGKPPFTGATPAAIFDQILNRAPTAPVLLNSGVTPGLEGVVAKLLDKDVDLRYQHASELRADLKRMRRDTDSGHRPPAASLGGAARWSALKVTGAAALGALALVAVVWSARSVVASGTSRDERAGAGDQPADRYGGALVVRQLVARRYPGCLRLHPERVDGRRRHVARGRRTSSRRGRAQRRGHASLVARWLPDRLPV